MSVGHTRTYKDPATGEVVARYISEDGENWVMTITTEEVEKREDTRRSIRAMEADEGPSA